LPRKSDLALITQQQLEQLVDRYNNTPRKCARPWRYSMPSLNVLHFNRESTPRLSPE